MKKHFSIRFFIVFLILSIFTIDLFVPPGSAISILYIVPIAFAYTMNRKAILAFIVLCSLLSVADPIIVYEKDMHYSIFVDRALSVVSIFIAGLIVARYKSETERADAHRKKHMDSVEEMLFRVSHEIRRPVNSIQGVTNMLESQELSKEDLLQVTAFMKESVTELDDFTKTLTEFLDGLQKENLTIKD